MEPEPIVVGIDPASTKLAFAALYGDDHLVWILTRLGKSGGPACSRARLETEEFIQKVRRTWDGVPVAAYIESAVLGRGGVKATMVQCYTSGAVLGALYDLGVATSVANVSTWKKRVVGRGNATKPEVADWLRLRWPALHAAANGNQDGYDAACIALYGQQLQRERLDESRGV